MGREEGSGWGTRVYLWQIHVDIWQNQYNIVKLKKKKNLGNFFALCLCVLEKIHVFSKNCLSIDTICKLFTLNTKYELLLI